MPISARFRETRKRIYELRRHFLPAEFSIAGDYSERVLDRARGFRLLVHAEIEAYIEDMCKETVVRKIRDWKRNGRPSNLLIAFIACYHSGWLYDDPEHNAHLIELARNRARLWDNVEEIVDNAQVQFVKVLSDNHGVKEKNLRSLVIPTGVEVDQLDRTWLTELDDFGKSRGEVAHKARSATGVIDPKSEFERAKRLLVGLKDLDALLINAE